MLLLGAKNTTSQTVLTNDIVNLGAVYRKYCKKIAKQILLLLIQQV